MNIQKKYETPAKAIQVEYKKNVKYIKIVNRFAFIWGKFFLFLSIQDHMDDNWLKVTSAKKR